MTDDYLSKISSSVVSYAPGLVSVSFFPETIPVDSNIALRLST